MKIMNEEEFTGFRETPWIIRKAVVSQKIKRIFKKSRKDIK